MKRTKGIRQQKQKRLYVRSSQYAPPSIRYPIALFTVGTLSRKQQNSSQALQITGTGQGRVGLVYR